MSSSNYCFLTCTQISQEASKVVWYSHLFKNFPSFVVIHTVKGFGFLIRKNMRQEIPRGQRSPLTSYVSHPTIPPTHTYTHWVRTGSSAALTGREGSHSLHTCSEPCMISAIISLLAWSFKTGNTIPILQMLKLRLRALTLPKAKQFTNTRCVWIQRLPSSPKVFDFLNVEAVFSN